MKLPVENKSGASLGIRLEPWCDEAELEPGQVADVSFEWTEADGPIQIDFHDENFLSLWVPPGATIKVRS